MEFVFKIGKKIIPRPVFEFFQPAYHFILSFAGALIYGFPSREMIVIGVTGTKGKTTTCNLIHHVLNSSGYKTGLSTTVNFKIGDREWQNGLKQTMPGRFHLQKLLSKMAKEGCKYAVVETSSEGILQFRHRFIDYDIAVFINLTPEHLERHKGFENYRKEKVKLFERVALKQNGIGVYNLDDENVEYFLKPKISEKYGYYLKESENKHCEEVHYQVKVDSYKLSPDKTEFTVNGVKYKTNLIGEFNVYNCAAAIAVANSQDIPSEQIQKSLASFKTVAGRMEVIDEGQNFAVIVDYAHEPNSLESVYKAVRETQMTNRKAKLICLLGSCGGGRDKWKRPIMGKIAATYCDEIILANEDPYDENPEKILDDIKAGIDRASFPYQKVHEIVNRREAIKKALSLAKKGDAVVFTGKGGEVWMCVENGRKIPWDEKAIVMEEVRSL